MASVASLLDRIKRDLSSFLPDSSIETACSKTGHRWRRRKLGPVQTLHLFIMQVLSFNTAMTHLRHLAGKPVKPSGYCKARKRLPLEALETLLAESSAALHKACASAGGLWCGLRAYLVDGSSTIAPDTPSSQKAFGQPKGCKDGCGFPVPKILGLFDAFSGLITQMLCFPLYTHDQSKVWMLHPLLKKGDVIVGDRAFCSLVHFSMLVSRGIHGVFRIHQRTIVNFRPNRKYRVRYKKGQKAGKTPMPRSRYVRRLGKRDQVVEWFKSATARPKWMDKKQYKALPASQLIRELRFSIPSKGQRTRMVTIATTLLDPVLYPKDKIAELYGVRWRVETHFGELKTTLKMRKVKSKTADGVKKELIVYALVYNLIHRVMTQAAARQGVMPHQISFIDTLRWLQSADPEDDLTELLINPHRPNRHEPRVVKDQQDSYTKMCRPRGTLQKEQKKQAVPA